MPDQLVREVKYVPLARRKPTPTTSSHLEKKVLGTKFGGENKVGLTIEQLMKLEAKLYQGYRFRQTGGAPPLPFFARVAGRLRIL